MLPPRRDCGCTGIGVPCTRYSLLPGPIRTALYLQFMPFLIIITSVCSLSPLQLEGGAVARDP